MAKNEKKNAIGLAETKGSFQVRGIVFGVDKEKFYKDTMTKTNNPKPFRAVNFGVKTDDKSTVYISLTGMEQDKVHFSKTETVDGKRVTDTEKVDWKDRFQFNKKDYKMIGTNVGVKKKKDEQGKDVNDKKILAPFDACKEVADNLKDGQSVFIKGKIEYSSYESKGKKKSGVKFVATQISLAKDVDFSEEGFKPISDFTQVIVLTGFSQREDDNKTLINAKVVTYNSIEEAEFVLEDKNLTATLKKNLKPYYALKVWGNIATTENKSEVESVDVWGSANLMDKQDSPVKRDLVITGVDPQTIEKETYSLENVEAALAKINSNKKAEKEFGEGGTESWGNSTNLSSSSDEDDNAWD